MSKDQFIVRVDVRGTNATKYTRLINRLTKAKKTKVVMSISYDLRNKRVQRIAVAFNYKVYSKKSAIINELAKFGKVQ